MKRRINDDGAIILVTAIVAQTVKDYKKAYKAYLKNPKDINRKRECEKLEEFFYSTYYETLCTLDGKAIIERIRQEVIDDKNPRCKYRKL